MCNIWLLHYVVITFAFGAKPELTSPGMRAIWTNVPLIAHITATDELNKEKYVMVNACLVMVAFNLHTVQCCE